MKRHSLSRLFPVALAAVLPTAAAAADDSVGRLVHPDSTVTLGVGSVSADSQRFGTYNGLAKDGVHLIGDASIVRRDDATATWFRLDARNLGLDTREVRVEHERQGDWAYYLDYSETPRFAPYDVHTSLAGIGTTSQARPANAGNTQQPATSAPETEIKTERAKTTLGLTKALNPFLTFSATLQSEEKKGNRLFGRGTGGAQEFLAEPIRATTRQVDLTLTYAADKLQLKAGYYGSFFDNHNAALNISGGATGLTAAPALTPIALPPDNVAHQLHVAGSYDFTRTTRGTFKYAYERNTQTDAFILPVTRPRPLAAGTGTNDSGRSDLGGRLDTTLFNLGLTSRPVKNLSLLANLRHENRDDKTALAQYIFPGAAATATTDGFNEPRSIRMTSGKLEASYLLPAGYRVTGGIDYDKKSRSMNGVRIVGFRWQTEEVGYRAELNRSLSDAVTGTVSYGVSRRDGSDFKNLYRLDGTTPYPAGTGGGLLEPIYIADRERDKVKALIDWAPLDSLSLQLIAEDSRDRYGKRGRTPDIGVRSGDARLYSVDATYALSEAWQLTGYGSAFTTQVEQATGATAAAYWTAGLKNVGAQYGFGIKGKVRGKVELGANLLWAEDRNEYHFGGAAASLPDINSVQTTMKAWARYAYDKDTAVRLEYVHDRRRTNDWTWNGYVYTDGSWLYRNPNEKVNFVGVSVQHGFR